jgi:copper chaperone
MKCSGCVEKIAPALNEILESSHWTVDLKHPDKLLTIEGNGISENAIKLILEKAGFAAIEV